jgi:hypothetical protein
MTQIQLQDNDNKEMIDMLSSLKFQDVSVPEFKFAQSTPSPYFAHFSNIQKQFVSMLLAVPVVAALFAIGFYFNTPDTTSEGAQLALLEASNARILTDIESLEK